MFQKEKASETIIGRSVYMKGNLKSEGSVVVEGKVNGEIKAKDSVFIKEGALVSGSIKAKEVIIQGEVQGNIQSGEKLEISSTGKVIGDIYSRILSISAGAFFVGKSTMESEKESKETKVKEIELEKLESKIETKTE